MPTQEEEYYGLVVACNIVITPSLVPLFLSSYPSTAAHTPAN